MAMTWGPAEDWDAIAVDVISLDAPQAGPIDTIWLDPAAGSAPHRGHLITLAGLTAAHATLPGSNVRVAAARDEHGVILVTCHRLTVRDRTGDYPADYRAYRCGGGSALHPCCQPDGDDRQELCGSLPEPGSRHCADHQDQDDARRRLTAWRDAGYRQADERAALIRAALAAGITKNAIHTLSGIARTTIDDVLAAVAKARQAQILAEHGTATAAAAALATRHGNIGEADATALATLLEREGWTRWPVSHHGDLSKDWYWHEEHTTRDGTVYQVHAGRDADGTDTGLIDAFSGDDRTTALKAIRAAYGIAALDALIDSL